MARTGSNPIQAAFDGERVLVTNYLGNSVTVFRAADLSLIGNVQLPRALATVGRLQRRDQLLGDAARDQQAGAVLKRQRMFPVCPSE
jgi:hypothetical protein